MLCKISINKVTIFNMTVIKSYLIIFGCNTCSLPIFFIQCFNTEVYLGQIYQLICNIYVFSKLLKDFHYL